MPYELHYDDGTGQTKKENLDDIVKSKEFKSWSPKDKADFLQFAHSKAKDPETGEQPDFETFVKDTHRAIAEAPRTKTERFGSWAVSDLPESKVGKAVGRALSPAIPEKYRKMSEEGSQEVVNKAGELFGDPGRKIAAVPAALLKGAEEMITPMDILPISKGVRGGAAAVEGLGKGVSHAWDALKGGAKAVKEADLGAMATADLGKAAGKAIEGAKNYLVGALPDSSAWGALKGRVGATASDLGSKAVSGAEKISESAKNYFKEGVLPKDYFPPPAEGKLIKEVPIPKRPNRAERLNELISGTTRDADAIARAQKITPQSDIRTVRAISREIESVSSQIKSLGADPQKNSVAISNLEKRLASYEAERARFGLSPKQMSPREAGGPQAPRGSLPAGSKAPKPLLEEPPRPKVEEPLVEPGSDPIGSPEAMQKAQMAAEAPKAPKAPLSAIDQASAAKAGEAELAGLPKPKVPRKITADDIATSQKLDKDIDSLVQGKMPEKAPVKKLNSLWERIKYGTKRRLVDEREGLKTVKFEGLHDKLLRGESAIVDLHKKDVGPALKALTDNIKTPEEKSLMNTLYWLRSYGEIYNVSKGAVDYGGIGAEALAKEARMMEGLKAAGKGEVWERVSKAVEQMADATNKIGLERARPVIGDKLVKEWGEKYRYYSSLQGFDKDVVKFAHGEEGLLNNAMPSMEDIATGFTETREGGKAQFPDIFEQFQKSHWSKIKAGYKKEVVDMAVKRGHELFGEGLEKELELVGGKGWGLYKTSDGMEHPMPDHIIQFLTESEPGTVSLMAEMAKVMNPVSRRGYLDLSGKYYSGMVLRDITDIILRSPGYLIPQTKFLVEKLNKGLGLESKAPDLISILNPAPWLRGLKASWRENFGYRSKALDPILDQLASQGALIAEPVQHAMKFGSLKALYPESAGGIVKKSASTIWENTGRILKFWDDAIRTGQYMRNLPQEYRGLKNVGKVWNLEHLPQGPVSKEAMSNITRGVTIDFNMSGSWTKELRAFNPFINPAIQDKFRTLEYAKNQPVSFTLTTAAMMSAAAASYMKWKSKPEGRLLNPRDTQRFVLGDTGLRSKSGGVYAYPMFMIPDSLQGIWVTMRNAIDVASEKDPEFRAILKKNYAQKTASNVTGTLANVSGPLVAVFETAINHSFYLGREIEGIYPPGMSTELKAAKGVPNLHRLMGKAGISPDKSAYLTRGLFGTPGIKAAEWLDPMLAKSVKLPREGTEKYGGPMDFLGKSIKNMPKTMGLMREQKYDKKFEESQEFMEPTLRKSADARQIIRSYGARHGQEKDPELKRSYLNKARELYRQYIASLEPDEKAKVLDFGEIFGGASEEAARSAAGEGPRSLRALKDKNPGVMRKLEIRNKEEEQAQ